MSTGVAGSNTLQNWVDATGAFATVNSVNIPRVRAVRIHAIGFPLDPAAPQFTNIRFAQLMRIAPFREGKEQRVRGMLRP